MAWQVCPSPLTHQPELRLSSRCPPASLPIKSSPTVPYGTVQSKAEVEVGPQIQLCVVSGRKYSITAYHTIGVAPGKKKKKKRKKKERKKERKKTKAELVPASHAVAEK
ncbi:hypothetical protein L873DRAFT_951603 [Choiromyces venosus 120613-1]|uniref:Uncharacterized protein n=1 Tax=Choiromyces venosus 120613-1 TaxID=1336337 RepID=A0A3N4K9P8_9PEZI|nr:hypothetical protein L873DRAFT_951603 [Choiromyces venosus 120613-1]